MSPLGHDQFGPQGFDWQVLCRGPLNIATYKIYKLWASWFQRRRFFFFLSFSHYKSMGAIYQHGGHLDLRNMTIFTNFNPPLTLHMKLEEIWPRGFRGEVIQRCEQTDRQTTDWE